MVADANIARLINGIKEDSTHGASELARRALKVLAIAAKWSRTKNMAVFINEQYQIGQQLISARPAMVSIPNVVNQLRRILEENSSRLDITAMKSLLVNKANDMIKASLRNVIRIRKYGMVLISEGDTILIYSFSSTVMTTLSEVPKTIKVLVLRSGAVQVDNRIKQQLTTNQILVSFIDSSLLNCFLPLVSQIILGADRICGDGSVINAYGTNQLVKLARKSGVPVHIMCETLKLDPWHRGQEILHEGKIAPECIDLPGSLATVVKKEPKYDITPITMVNSIVTERGILAPDVVLQLMKNQSAT
jgi:translation initiation factor 2B subunit (eIF-2B alpha/beta/delta family)